MRAIYVFLLLRTLAETLCDEHVNARAYVRKREIDEEDVINQFEMERVSPHYDILRNVAGDVVVTTELTPNSSRLQEPKKSSAQSRRDDELFKNKIGNDGEHVVSESGGRYQEKSAVSWWFASKSHSAAVVAATSKGSDKNVRYYSPYKTTRRQMDEEHVVSQVPGSRMTRGLDLHDQPSLPETTTEKPKVNVTTRYFLLKSGRIVAINVTSAPPTSPSDGENSTSRPAFFGSRLGNKTTPTEQSDTTVLGRTVALPTTRPPSTHAPPTVTLKVRHQNKASSKWEFPIYKFSPYRQDAAQQRTGTRPAVVVENRSTNNASSPVRRQPTAAVIEALARIFHPPTERSFRTMTFDSLKKNKVPVDSTTIATWINAPHVSEKREEMPSSTPTPATFFAEPPPKVKYDLARIPNSQEATDEPSTSQDPNTFRQPRHRELSFVTLNEPKKKLAPVSHASTAKPPLSSTAKPKKQQHQTFHLRNSYGFQTLSPGSLTDRRSFSGPSPANVTNPLSHLGITEDVFLAFNFESTRRLKNDPYGEEPKHLDLYSVKPRTNHLQAILLVQTTTRQPDVQHVPKALPTVGPRRTASRESSKEDSFSQTPLSNDSRVPGTKIPKRSPPFFFRSHFDRFKIKPTPKTVQNATSINNTRSNQNHTDSNGRSGRHFRFRDPGASKSATTEEASSTTTRKPVRVYYFEPKRIKPKLQTEKPIAIDKVGPPRRNARSSLTNGKAAPVLLHSRQEKRTSEEEKVSRRTPNQQKPKKDLEPVLESPPVNNRFYSSLFVRHEPNVGTTKRNDPSTLEETSLTSSTSDVVTDSIGLIDEPFAFLQEVDIMRLPAESIAVSGGRIRGSF